MTNIYIVLPLLPAGNMESNGDNMLIANDDVSVIIKLAQLFGANLGTNGQQPFYQLIHQGTMLIPCNFIAYQRKVIIH